MTDKKPIPRRYVEDALNLLGSLKGELEDSLTEKGFMSHVYLDEKLEPFVRQVRDFIDHPTGEVESA
jgi:hypothetical protein